MDIVDAQFQNCIYVWIVVCLSLCYWELSSRFFACFREKIINATGNHWINSRGWSAAAFVQDRTMTHSTSHNEKTMVAGDLNPRTLECVCTLHSQPVGGRKPHSKSRENLFVGEIVAPHHFSCRRAPEAMERAALWLLPACDCTSAWKESALYQGPFSLVTT